MAKNTETFAPDNFSLVPKGRMVLLYGEVDGEDVHIASFFHENKAAWVAEAIEGYHEIEMKKTKKKAKK